jgi:hypothetical protein
MPAEVKRDHAPPANALKHPIAASESEISEWRKWLIDNQITQPFKQAHREIYVLTNAERETDLKLSITLPFEGDHMLSVIAPKPIQCTI